MSHIEIAQTDSAEALLALLSPLHPLWQPDPRSWIFRGHSDARWLLVPNALRNDTSFGFGVTAARGLRRTQGGQIEAEFDMLEQFLVALDNQGYPLPGNLNALWFDWGRIQDEVRDAATLGGKLWPPNELLGLLALAQHHGLPTRLLDWSRSPRVAAYFAAVSAARWVRDGFPTNPPTTHLSVWAFRERATRGLWKWDHDHVSLVGTPSEHNENLRAQQGLFTVHMQKCLSPGEPPTVASVDEMLAGAIETAADGWGSSVTGDDAILREFTLPVSEAPRLLRMLSFEGVSYASMFPTLDGVVGGLVERRYWR